MMRAAAAPADAPTPCPLCTHLNTHSLTHRVAARLRPLLARLSPMVSWLPPCPRLRVLWPYRHSSRWIVVLAAAALFMMILLSYISPHHIGAATWLAAFGAGSESAGNLCTLVCPKVPADDSAWQLRAQPQEHACLSTAILPVPCAPNYTHSELLRMPPIRFLRNYLNPCWYEPMPPAAGPNQNPYRQNLFVCFSHGAFGTLKEMAEQSQVRRETERHPQRLRCLPHFYIAGMPKCGSTDLFVKAMFHPDVVRAPIKEPHWWGKNRFGQRMKFSSAIPLKDYVDLFDKAAQQIESRQEVFDDVTPTDEDVRPAYHPVVTVDASASTFWNNDEWWRLPENCGRTEPLFTTAHYIRRLTPQARIIVILRNPTERLYSDYLYFTTTNKSVAAFHEDVMMSMEKLRVCAAQRSLRACIYDKQVANGKAKVRLRVGVYHVYLSEWLKVFPREQLLVLRTEDYSKNVLHTMRHVYQFLGLRPLTRREEKRIVDLPIANTRKLKDRKLGAMWHETRQALQDFYRPHNERLAQLLRDPRFLWDDVTTTATPLQQKGEGGGERGRGGGENLTERGAEFEERGGSDADSAVGGDDTTAVDDDDDGGYSQNGSDDAAYDVNGDVDGDVNGGGGGDSEGGVRGADADAVTDADVEDVTDYAQNGQDGEEEEEEEAEDYEDSGYSYSDSAYDEEEYEQEEEEEEENNDEDS